MVKNTCRCGIEYTSNMSAPAADFDSPLDGLDKGSVARLSPFVLYGGLWTLVKVGHVRLSRAKGMNDEYERTSSCCVLQQLRVNMLSRELNVPDDRAPNEAVLNCHLQTSVVSSQYVRRAGGPLHAPCAGASPHRGP